MGGSGDGISPLTVWLTGLILALVLFVIVFPALCTACYHFVSYKHAWDRDDEEGERLDETDYHGVGVSGVSGLDDDEIELFDDEEEEELQRKIKECKHYKNCGNRWRYCHPIILSNHDGVKVIGSTSVNGTSTSERDTALLN